MGARFSRVLAGRPKKKPDGFLVLEESVTLSLEVLCKPAPKPEVKPQRYIGSDDSDDEVIDDGIVESDLVEINRLEMSDSSDTSYYSTKSKRAKAYKGKSTRTERFFNRRLKQVEFTKSVLVNRLKSKRQLKLEAHVAQLEKVQVWQKDFDPKEIPMPETFLLNTEGITEDQRIILSKMVFDAIRPINLVVDLKPVKLDKRKPFIMVHQTNEFEIMTRFGSFRLNPNTEGVRDIDSLAYVEAHPYIFEAIFELGQAERHRRTYSFDQKNNRRLTLTRAYDIAHNFDVEGVKPETGIAATVRWLHRHVTRIRMLPVIHCRNPVFGVPWKEYMTDVVDLPEYPIELLQAMNVYLKPHKVQVLDMRVRSEELINFPPYIIDEYQVAREACNVVLRSRHLVYLHTKTSKYFVVYGFYNFLFPFRFYQIIVRPTPGVPVPHVDFVNNGSRLEISEPEPRSYKYDNLYYPSNAVAVRQRREELRLENERAAASSSSTTF